MWENKKYKFAFKSSYQKTSVNIGQQMKVERVFTLTSVKGGIVKSYESWQSAKKDGWIKIK